MISRTSLIVATLLAGYSIAPLSAVQDAMIKNRPAGFVAVRPDKIKWIPNPEVPGVQSAVLLGDPERPGPLIVRIRLPAHFQIEPHTHREARTYTVLSGEWKLGFGEKFDAERLDVFPQGGLYRLPAKVSHFQAAGPQGATIQIESIGPSSIDFLNPGRKWALPPTGQEHTE